MTCEVAIMNRQALVLAVDSVGTVRTWLYGTQHGLEMWGLLWGLVTNLESVSSGSRN